jgi:hypothetical protein
MIGTFRSDLSQSPIAFNRSADAAAHVARTQGIIGSGIVFFLLFLRKSRLWRGLVPSMVRVSIGAGLYFGIINLTLVKNEQGTPTKQVD